MAGYPRPRAPWLPHAEARRPAATHHHGLHRPRRRGAGPVLRLRHACDAAVRTGRRWIGIDITYIAVDLIRNRLRQTHGKDIDATYDVRGVPADLAAAHALFEHNAFDFERWAVSLVRGTPNQKQVGDKGRDGVVRFYNGPKRKPGQIIVSVKGGKQLNPSMVRDLGGTVAHDDKVDGGILVTLWNPTAGMRQEAQTSGNFTDMLGNSYPRLQILTVEELLRGVKPNVPLVIPPYTEARPLEETVEEMMLFRSLVRLALARFHCLGRILTDRRCVLGADRQHGAQYV